MRYDESDESWFQDMKICQNDSKCMSFFILLLFSEVQVAMFWFWVSGIVALLLRIGLGHRRTRRLQYWQYCIDSKLRQLQPNTRPQAALALDSRDSEFGSINFCHQSQPFFLLRVDYSRLYLFHTPGSQTLAFVWDPFELCIRLLTPRCQVACCW